MQNNAARWRSGWILTMPLGIREDMMWYWDNRCVPKPHSSFTDILKQLHCLS